METTGGGSSSGTETGGPPAGFWSEGLSAGIGTGSPKFCACEKEGVPKTGFLASAANAAAWIPLINNMAINKKFIV